MSDSIFDIIESIANIAQNQGQKSPMQNPIGSNSNTNLKESNVNKTQQKNNVNKPPNKNIQSGSIKEADKIMEGIEKTIIEPVETETADKPEETFSNFDIRSQEDVLRGVIFSEILGRPKAFKRGR